MSFEKITSAFAFFTSPVTGTVTIIVSPSTTELGSPIAVTAPILSIAVSKEVIPPMIALPSTLRLCSTLNFN